MHITLPAPCWVLTDGGETRHYPSQEAALARRPGSAPVRRGAPCVDLLCPGCGASPSEGDYHYPTVPEAVYEAVCGGWQVRADRARCPRCAPDEAGL
ncbi:hypothetical protein [Nocardiopsis composta]|uniref:Ribosomal protein S27AE n=1 Tax=Nocardiopsis composta TaxID=157465 RepID=A0A7W8VHK5_9ACTN|nr:hypothetical protein [Nocardiopsis composta]MBB5436313.1 ribosomal protein S27AE [Nocardiopsis composta]